GDRHDALVALDRREALDLQGIDEAHEDATLLRFGQQLVHRTGARAALVRHEQALHLTPRADGLEDGVGAGDRLSRLVRRRRAGARTRGHAPDLLGVGGTGGPAPAASTHRTRAAEAAGRLRTERAATGGAGRRAGTRDPARTAPAATALCLLTALVRGELSCLRRLLVVTRRQRAARGHGATRRRAEALAARAAATAPSPTARSIAEIPTLRAERSRLPRRAGLGGLRRLFPRGLVSRGLLSWGGVVLPALVEFVHRHAPLPVPRSQR